MKAKNDITGLQRQYAELQRQVTRFSVVEQKLIRTRDELDRELLRFQRIAEFNRRAIIARDLPSLAEVIAEAVVDIFEVAVGALFLCSHGPEQVVAECIIGCDDKSEAMQTMDISEFRRKDGPVIEVREQRKIWDRLELRQVICSPCFDSNGDLQALVGGRSEANKLFYDEITNELIPSFHVFSLQTETLLRNLQMRQDLLKAYQDANMASVAKNEFFGEHEPRGPYAHERHPRHVAHGTANGARPPAAQLH